MNLFIAHTPEGYRLYHNKEAISAPEQHAFMLATSIINQNLLRLPPDLSFKALERNVKPQFPGKENWMELFVSSATPDQPAVIN